MKKMLVIISIILFTFSCGKDDGSSDPFKGEDVTASKTIGKPGNYWDGAIRGFDTEMNGTILTNDEGVTEIDLELGDFGDLVEEIKYNGEVFEGEQNLKIRAKFSTNTIATFDYGSTDDTDPFVLVKFDGSIGDKYTHTANGKTTVREITDKDLEVEAFGWIIKVFAVEETVPLNTLTIKLNGEDHDITKLRYLINHRFGFTMIQVYIDGGTWPLLFIDAVNTNCDTQ